MKTAISIPNTLFQSAEAFASTRGLSRSELYARALELYLQTHQDSDVTDTLNGLYADETSSLNPDVKRAEVRALPKEAW